MAKYILDTGEGPIFPEGTVGFARDRFFDVLGFVLIGFAVALAIAVVTYAPGDPSFNNATNLEADNFLGLPGAHAADGLLQILGVAGLIPSIAFTAWGWQLIYRRRISLFWIRVVMLSGALVFLAIAAAGIPTPESWSIRSGLGGITGSLLLAHLTNFFENSAGVWATLFISLTAAVLGIPALVAALGLYRSEWMALGRALALGVRICGQMARTAITFPLKLAGWKRSWAAGRDLTDGPLSGAARARMKKIKAAKRVTAGASRLKTGSKAQARRQQSLNLGIDQDYSYPPLDLLAPPEQSERSGTLNRSALEQNARLLETVLGDFGVRGEIVKVRPGPVVTLYELAPAPGTKTSRVIGLSDDIARSMSAISVRVAVVSGQNAIGIEMPNARREIVRLRELLASEDLERSSGKLNLALGKDIAGAPVLVDLARMPHLLIAGTTGSGKSVAVNTMILSLLYQLPPETCKFIMIDPKMLELSVYDGIPHLLSPVVTDPSKAVVALKWTVREMEDRYRLISHLGVRNIAGYNARIEDACRKGEVLTRRVQTGFGADGSPVFEEQPLSMEALPFIVVVVDEMADLMLVAGRDIEAAVQRLAQMARAAGIHLITATQRPSVDVITGTIKANFPTRVSFQVTSKIDSRTILGEQGAEQLLGQGDMLYMAGGGRISRVHGPFVTDEEVEQVVAFLKEQGKPDYIESVTEESEDGAPMFLGDPAGGGLAAGGGNSEDVLYDQAVAIVAREGKASTSFIQRHLQIGYNRAARIIERMESEGVVSKSNRVGRREVLVQGHDD